MAKVEKKASKPSQPSKSTALVAPQNVGISKEKKERAQTSGGGLAFMRLIAKNSDLDALPKGAKAGDYLLANATLIPSTFTEGGFVAILPLTQDGGVIMREHAIVWEGGSITHESFDSDDETWAEIEAIKRGRKSGDDEAEQRAQLGADYLMYLPEHKCFVSQPYMNSARRSSGKLIELAEQKHPVRIRSKKVTSGGNTWYVPEVSKETLDGAPQVPPMEAFIEAIKLFESYKLETKAPKDAPER